MKENKRIQTKHGVTLVALIITVIILLILAGTAISIAVNGGDLFGKATEAKSTWNNSVAEEQTQLDDLLAILNSITMTLDGVEVSGINKTNFAQYLGKVVTNYSGASTSVTIGEDTYTVSNTYRLYWIDWTNKYGDGPGTIYLKADYTANNYAIQQEATESAIDAVSANSTLTTKIRNLNPGLYVGGTPTPPAVNSNNMKAVRWLTNPSNWNSLKTGITPSIANKVNYVVGAPSIEMMFDSYNTHYGLTNETMDTGARDSSSARTKLAYMYPAPTGLNNYGYAIGPSNEYYTAVDGYKYSTSSYTVQTDSEIDSMYFPGDDSFYWLASPAANDDSSVLYVAGNYGGLIYTHSYDGILALCPIVSLAADVQL